ncbi:MAG: GTPase HflX [Flavobacteriales bacterium]|nr:GTPase HflX [Flavobacteriales bacterium]
MIETAKKAERCVLVGLVTKSQDRRQTAEYLDELEFLAETAHAQCVARFTQSLDHPDPKTFVGSGKLQEIIGFVREHKPDLVIFDDELSPGQQRNLEREFNKKDEEHPSVKILDRNSLILDIFASRARTAHARRQVELAQYEYMLPRLTRLWTHLEKQRGGIGMRGPGEQEIETDRRIVRDRIVWLKNELKQIDKQKRTQRSNRGALVRAALVGYTNAGKSTLMNVLSKSDVFAENKLFATLDTTVRKVVLSDIPFLLTDTVGFIRKLPHQLIESFKSTLDETLEADILIHVADISHPAFEDHFQVVNDTLAEIGCAGKPTIVVFNKIDAFQHTEKDPDDLAPAGKEHMTLEEWKHTWMSRIPDAEVVFISALEKTGITQLRDVLHNKVREIHMKRYPNSPAGNFYGDATWRE